MDAISTLAGIIQGEASNPADQFGVASTIYNRSIGLPDASGTPFPSVFGGGSNNPLAVATASGQFSAYPNALGTPSANAVSLATALENGNLSSLGTTGNALYYNAPGTNPAYAFGTNNSYGPGTNQYSDGYNLSPSSNFQLPQVGATLDNVANSSAGDDVMAYDEPSSAPNDGGYLDDNSYALDAINNSGGGLQADQTGGALASQYASPVDVSGYQVLGANTNADGSVISEPDTGTGTVTNDGLNGEVTAATPDESYSVSGDSSAVTAPAPADTTASATTATNPNASAQSVPAAIDQQTNALAQIAQANEKTAAADASAINKQTAANTQATTSTSLGIVASIETWTQTLFVRFGVVILGIIFIGAALWMLAPKEFKQIIPVPA